MLAKIMTSMQDNALHFFTNFINGLKKSFSGKDYLRDLHQCDICAKPSFSAWCQWCEVKKRYEDSDGDKKWT